MTDCISCVSRVLQDLRGTSLTIKLCHLRSTSSQNTTCGIICISSSWWRLKTQLNTLDLKVTWLKWLWWVIRGFDLELYWILGAFPSLPYPCPILLTFKRDCQSLQYRYPGEVTDSQWTLQLYKPNLNWRCTDIYWRIYSAPSVIFWPHTSCYVSIPKTWNFPIGKCEHKSHTLRFLEFQNSRV